MKPVFLDITNFKSIGSKPQRIELAPITLLFGPNSAGKSTVLQSLIYLREALFHKNYDPDKTDVGGEWLDLGGFANLVNGHDLKKPIEFAISFDIENEQLPDYLSEYERNELENAELDLPEKWLGEVNEVSICLSFRWSEVRGHPYAESYECWINGERIAVISSTADGKQIFLDEFNASHPAFMLDDSSIESEDEVDDFQSRFLELFSNVQAKGTDPVDELLSQSRPFKTWKVEALENLFDGGISLNVRLFRKIREELSLRSSRRAAELAEKIGTITLGDIEEKPVRYLTLAAQTDAIPDKYLGLVLGDLLRGTETDLDADELRFRQLAESLISGFVVGPLVLLTNWLNSFKYIGPIRDLPARGFHSQRTPDPFRWAKGLAGWEFLHRATSRQISEINYWLGSECLKTGYQVVVHRYRELPVDTPLLTYLDQEMEFDQQLILKEMIEGLPIQKTIILQEEETGLELMPQDIGVGISQVFPVVVLTIIQESGLIAIEQPELHVHPAIQVELADLFARYAIQNNTMMLLETHSEHLLLRLLRRIRESNQSVNDVNASVLTQESVSVQYVQSTPEGTQFSRLRIDDEGDFLDEWPNGFFDERDEELFF